MPAREDIVVAETSPSGIPRVGDEFYDQPEKRKDVGAGKPNLDAMQPPGAFGTRPSDTSTFEGMETAEVSDMVAKEMARAATTRRTAAKISALVAKVYWRYFTLVDRVDEMKKEAKVYQDFVTKRRQQKRR